VLEEVAAATLLEAIDSGGDFAAGIPALQRGSCRHRLEDGSIGQNIEMLDTLPPGREPARETSLA
jgi:hypothetical protein